MKRVDGAVAELAEQHFDWGGWEALIERNGITIDRPHGSTHPRFPRIIYPLDYGYVRDTVATDGHAVDVFVGRATRGLVGFIVTTDYRQGDREIKLLYNCTPEEIYLVQGFINFDRSLLEGRLVLRYPMHELWN